MHTHKASIFWADDDIDDLELFKEVLVQLAPDHQLQQFENGQQLLAHLQALGPADYPCLIVLDMNMPVLNGRETLVAIKNENKYKSIPVAVFTTSDSALDKIFCKRHNTEMITKPPSYDQLKKVVQSLVTLCH